MIANCYPAPVARLAGTIPNQIAVAPISSRQKPSYFQIAGSKPKPARREGFDCERLPVARR